MSSSILYDKVFYVQGLPKRALDIIWSGQPIQLAQLRTDPSDPSLVPLGIILDPTLILKIHPQEFTRHVWRYVSQWIYANGIMEEVTSIRWMSEGNKSSIWVAGFGRVGVDTGNFMQTLCDAKWSNPRWSNQLSSYEVFLSDTDIMELPVEDLLIPIFATVKSYPDGTPWYNPRSMYTRPAPNWLTMNQWRWNLRNSKLVEQEI